MTPAVPSNAVSNNAVPQMPTVVEILTDKVVLLDQRELPSKCQFMECTTHQQVALAISEMRVRGAPALGVAAAAGMYLACTHATNAATNDTLEYLTKVKAELDAARPTAVNLMWATNRCLEAAKLVASIAANLDAKAKIETITHGVKDEMLAILKEDKETNMKLGSFGASAILKLKGENQATPVKNQAKSSNRVSCLTPVKLIHHCNTGHLATTGYGTALGVVYTLFDQGIKVHVFVDETRPRLQGAKLTCWELKQCGVPHTLMVDGASSLLMMKHSIDAIVFGADRCAANGDVVNKIGTCNLCIVGKNFNVPRFACVPTSTIDLSIPCGSQIPIEERSPDEVTQVSDNSSSVSLAPSNTDVWNPAFDVTPAEFITAIVTEVGVVWGPDFSEGLKQMKALAAQQNESARAGRLAELQSMLDGAK